MLNPEFHKGLDKPFFGDFYKEIAGNTVVGIESSNKKIDLDENGPYANYNWELLYHVPLSIAVHLSKNQRFAEAQRWFHYIFDPTCNDTSEPAPKRFWKFLKFRDEEDPTRIDKLLALLSKHVDDLTVDEADQKKKILDGYEAIKDKPFQPHAVARTRTLAYQYSVVQKYLDNLIAWGDNLFRQDTVESINEATQRYVLAANLLGARPQRIPQRGSKKTMTFAKLNAKGLDAMGNALVELEGKFPFNLGMPIPPGTGPDASGPLFGIGRTLYFCIPRNEKMLGYWDTVATRLFYIRNSMNIEGVFRKLALFDPPLNLDMMLKAAAAGISIGSVVSGLNQPVSQIRAPMLIQKALELCSEVRGLGSSLLSALEKEDGERMALLRQGHEIKIQELSKEVRFLQWKQAQESTEALLRGRASALERYHHYQRLLGIKPDDEAVPEALQPDRQRLTEENFDETYGALVEQFDKPVPTQTLPALKLAGESGTSSQGKLYLNTNEDAELNSYMPLARDTRLAASVCDTIAAVLTFIPEFNVNLHYWGLGASSKVFGGSKLSDAVKIGSGILRTISAWEQDKAGMASKTASYERRADDWKFQSNLASHELMQIGRQLIGSLIAEQIAEHEYRNIQKQIEHTQEVDRFLHDKFTNEELYAWMQGEISRLYYEYYRFAFDIARKAEQTMKRELMRPEVDKTDYVKFNYWDGGRKGLLSGDALHLDVKRMEMAYHENNKREYELIKNVSIRQLDPLALLALKATGSCEVTMPEWLFDLGGSGHYMRRIKSVSLSIPSVVGPYTSINCTLSLLKSSLRKSPMLKDGEYSRQGGEDDRFVDYYGTVQSVVTSGGNNDSGMFESNLRDERILPFEGAGAESTWRLELPAAFRQFDYNTISDAILHVRYTARQGGALLRDKAVANLEEAFLEVARTGLTHLSSLAHDFPTEWYRFHTGAGDFGAKVKSEHFPYITYGRDFHIDSIELHAIKDGEVKSVTPGGLDLADLAQKLNGVGAFDLSLTADAEVLKRDKKALVFLLIKYTLESA
jgi:hypothetical protein